MAQAKTKTCESCLRTFKGRADARTCSARCRKRLQRAAIAAVKEVELVEHKIEQAAAEVENLVKPDYATEEGFIAVADPPAGAHPLAQPVQPDVNPLAANGLAFQSEPVDNPLLRANPLISQYDSSELDSEAPVPEASRSMTQYRPGRPFWQLFSFSGKFMAGTLTVALVATAVIVLVDRSHSQQNPAPGSVNGQQTVLSAADFGDHTLRINFDTTLANGKQFTATGPVVIQNEVNSAEAFKIQNANGSNILVADTSGNQITIGDKPLGQVALNVNGDITTNGSLVSTGGYSLTSQGLTIGNTLVCTANGCVSSSSPAPTPSNPTIDVANLAYINANQTFSGVNSFNNTSTTAFQVQNSGGTDKLFMVDTVNNRIGIGTTPSASGATLQVAGDLNVASGVYRIGNVAGANLTCGPNELLQQGVISGGILTSGTCVTVAGASTPTLQQVYDTSTPSSLTLSSASGVFQIQDAASPLATNLFEVTNNGASIKYFAVNSLGISVTGNINTTGQYQVNGGQVASSDLADGSNLAKLNANQTFSGVNSFTSASNTFSGNGANLTNLNGSNIASGTVGDTFLSNNITKQGNTFNGVSQLVQLTAGGILPVLNGSNLTALNAGNVGSGTLNDARLSSNVALLNANNIFLGNNSFHLNTTALSVQDASTPLGADLFTVTDNGGVTKYFEVSASGAKVNGNTVCTSAGNCVGTGGGGAVGGSGAAGTIAVFTGSGFTIGDSNLSQSGTTTNAAGNISLATGAQYQINGTQISSAALSNDSNLAKLNANQTFSGNNTFSSASNSFTGDGSGLTSLNASNVSSGTLNDSRLSSNVALLNANQTFTGNNIFQLSTAGLAVQDAASPLGTDLFTVTDNSGLTKYFEVSSTTAKVNGNDVCTTAGNCVGTGGGGSIGGGGTAGKLAKFTGSGFTVGDSLLSDNGSTVTVGGNLGVNTIVPTATLTIGVAAQTLALQGDASTSLSATSGGIKNSLVFATPTVSNKTITLPDASGTVAVSVSGPLSLDAAGNLSCPSCLTSGGPGAGVSSINSQTGAITLAGTTNQVIITASAGPTFTFSTPQDINTTSSPTFANINVTGQYKVGGSQIASSNLSDGSNLAKLNANQTFTGNNTFNNTLSAPGLTTSGLSLGIGASTAALNLSGNYSSNLAVTDGTNTTTIGFSGAAVGNVTYNFDASAAAGAYTICTTANTSACLSSSAVTTSSSGTNGTIAMFTGAQTIANSILTQASTTVSAAGNLNVTGQYQVGGTQIASSNLSDGANLAKLNANQTFTGNNTFQGSTTVQKTSTTAFQIQNATTPDNLFIADTSNHRVAIDQATATYTLDVAGDINTTTGYRIGGTPGSGITCSGGQVVQNATVSGGIITAGSCIANGAGATTTLQDAYNNSSSPATIATTSAAKGIIFKAGSTFDSTTLFQLQNANGNDYIQADTLGANLYLGNTGIASTIQIGNTTGAVAQTINIGNNATASSNTTSVLGSTIDGSTTTIQAGTGGLNLNPSGASNTGVLVKPGANSTLAFQVQNATGGSLMTIDSINSAITLDGNTSGQLAQWATNTNNLPTSKLDTSAVTVNGYIYVIGGSPATTVYYAKVNADGSTGTWNTDTNSLPLARGGTAAATANGYIYVIGGYDGGSNSTSTVYYAKVNADGSTGTWNSIANSLPQVLSKATSIVANGYVYVIGGDTGAAVKSTVYYAQLNADGTIGAWNTNNNALPANRAWATSAMANGYVYVMGGYLSGTSAQSSVYYASLNTNGSTSGWTTSGNTLPGNRMNATTVVSNGYIYEIGGQDATSTFQSTVYYAKLNTDGSIGTWSTNSNALPVARGQASSVITNGYVYQMGGSSNSSTVYYASTSRLQVGANLDLIGLQSGDGSAGGSLTAGNGLFDGSLQVQGAASFAQGVSIAGNLTNTGSTLFASSTGLSSAFQVQNTTGSQAINVSTVTTPNLISNADFESTTNGWNGKGSATILRNDTTAIGAASGVGALKITTTAAANDGASFNYTFKASTQYTLSLYARSSAGTVSTISIGRQDVANTDIDCLSSQSITTTFTHFTCTFTTGATITPPTQIYIKQSDATARTFYIDGVQLEQASSASSFQANQANFQVQTATNTITLDGSDSGALGTWSTNTNSLPATRRVPGSVTANGYVYVIGGMTSGSPVSTVYYAKLNADGSIGSWTTSATPLPASRYEPATVTANGYVYVIGGEFTGGSSGEASTVYYAKLNADGSTGAWQTGSNSLPQGVAGAVSTISNGYVYVMGGFLSGIGVGSLSTVYYAKLNADGSTGAWQTNVNALPAVRSCASGATANGYVYVMGGSNFTGNQECPIATAQSTVYYAKLNSDGSVGTWQTNTNTLPLATESSTTVVTNGYIYVVGGSDGTNSRSTVYYAKLNADGSTGAWQTNINALPVVDSSASSVIANGYVYMMGGCVATCSSESSAVYYASTARLQIGANLDLVGLQGGTLSDPGDISLGSTGGSLTASNGLFVGSLQVQGQGNFAQGLEANGNLTIGGSALFQNSANSTIAFQIENTSGTSLFTVDTTNSKLTVASDIVASNSATATTGTTSGVGGSNVTSITLAAAGSFVNGDVILVDNTGGTGQDFYTRITAGGGTTTLTVSPAVSYGTAAGYTGNAAITKYNIQNIGATNSDYTTQTNRFFQGYFLGGIVTGAGSTIYSDGNIKSATNLQIAAPGITYSNPSGNSTTAFQIQNAAGNNYIQVDTSGANLNLGNTGIASTVQIGNTTGAVAQTINIGNNTTASSTSAVTIGNLLGTSSTIIQGGTGAGAISLQAGSSGTILVGTANSNAITLGGNVTASANIDVTGSVALKNSSTNFATTGASAAANFGNVSLVRLTGASTQTINGIANPRDGYTLTIINAAAQTAIISNDSASGTVNDKIYNGTGSDINLLTNASITVVYDLTSTHWRVVGSAASTNSGVTTVGAFSGSSQTNGASISGSTITFGPADTTNPGMISTGTQTFAGDKTFKSTTNSTTAFQIQNSASSSTLLNLLQVDTVNSNITFQGPAVVSPDTPASPGVAAGTNSGGTLSGAAGTTYYYKITALNGSGESAGSTEVSINGASFTPISAPSSAPTPTNAAAGSVTCGAGGSQCKWEYTFVTANGETTASPASAGQSTSGRQWSIALSSTGPAGTTACKIYRSSNNGTSYALAVTQTPCTTPATDNNASPSGAPPGSNTATTNLNNATVSWTASAGATSYRIYRGTATGAENAYQTNTSSPFTDTGAAGTAGTPPTSGATAGSTFFTVNNANNNVAINTDSTTAFQVQTAGAVSVLSIDTVNSVITLGSASSNPVILVLGTKNTAGDPATCTSGALYYNSNTSDFRGCAGGTWVSLVSTGTPVGTILAYAGATVPSGYLSVDGSSQLRSTYSTLFSTLDPSQGTVTITIASPAVVTLSGNTLIKGDHIFLETTGALPTGLTNDTMYCVLNVSGNTFNLGTYTSSTYNSDGASNNQCGSAINTSGSQSGTHTLYFSPYGVADSTHFYLPDLQGRVPVGASGSGGTQEISNLGNQEGLAATLRNVSFHNTSTGSIYNFFGGANTSNGALCGCNSASGSITVNSTSTGDANNINKPSYLTVDYLIKF